MIINSVIKGGGSTPTGTISITSNGTHDVTNYASANVNVPTTAPARYVEYSVNAAGVLKKSSSSPFMSMSGVTAIGDNALLGVYSRNPSVPANVDMSSVVIVYENGMKECFDGCQTIKTLDLSSMSKANSYAFQNAFGGNSTLESIDLSSLVDCNGTGTTAKINVFDKAFQPSWSAGTSALTSVNLSGLTIVNGSSYFSGAFKYCRQLTSVGGAGSSVNFASLATISGFSAFSEAFSDCTGLVSFVLPALTAYSGNGSFFHLCKDCSALTTVSFPVLNTVSQQLGTSSDFCPFGGCTALSSVSFGGLTASTFASKVNQLQYLFDSTTGSTATGGCVVHFPSNFDPNSATKTFDASTLSGYPTFGGSSSYISVAFDLPATE